MQRAVGQEDADLRQPGRDIVSQLGGRKLRRQHDRPDRTGGEVRLVPVQVDEAPRGIESVAPLERKHDGQRLVRAAFSLTQFCDGRKVACIAHDVVPADAFHGDDGTVPYRLDSGAQRPARVHDIGLTSRLERQLRTAFGTGNRLRVEASVERIAILAFAVCTQRESGHARVRAVVRQRFDQRVTRPALRAVDKGITIAAVLRIS